MLVESEHAQGVKFRQQLAFRETARRAFHSADNDAVLRRAMLRRSHPHRGWYQPGGMGHGMERRKRAKHRVLARPHEGSSSRKPTNSMGDHVQ